MSYFVDGLSYGLVGFGAVISFMACVGALLGIASLLGWALSDDKKPEPFDDDLYSVDKRKRGSK
jgi:Na+-transporting NADH:ubiquinone oxidoreductase subunit NqrD